MNKEKQIEEMCEVLRKNAVSCQTCVWYAEGLCIGNCELAEDNQTVCETLYNAGYRKASEVAEEIFAEIDKIIDKHYNKHIFYSDLEDTEKEAVMDFSGDVTCDIDKLKKKFAEDLE